MIEEAHERINFLEKIHGLLKPTFFICFYSIWIVSFRMLALTLITYFTASASTHFQDINEIFNANELSLMGLCSISFFVLLNKLTYLDNHSIGSLIQRKYLEKNFFPGFLQGIFSSAILVLTFMFFGFYRYFGNLIQIIESPFESASILLRTISLLTLVYFEEFFFREKLVNQLKNFLSPLLLPHVIALFYCWTKNLQFDLGLNQLLSLYLLSVGLTCHVQKGRNFARGAGFFSGVLILFHPLLSLPIFGNDFIGVVLLKSAPNLTPMIQYLTGGSKGPMSGFGFQLLLILGLARSILNQK